MKIASLDGKVTNLIVSEKVLFYRLRFLLSKKSQSSEVSKLLRFGSVSGLTLIKELNPVLCLFPLYNCSEQSSFVMWLWVSTGVGLLLCNFGEFLFV